MCVTYALGPHRGAQAFLNSGSEAVRQSGSDRIDGSGKRSISLRSSQGDSSGVNQAAPELHSRVGGHASPVHRHCLRDAPTIGAETHLRFGGTKQTGNGHCEAANAAIDFFTEWKTVYIDYSDKLQRAQIDSA